MPFLRIVALSLLFAVAAPALAHADDTTDLRRKITITGDSSTVVSNDAARVIFGVHATRPTAGAALKAASRQMQRVLGAVRAGGVAAADIQTRTVSVSKLAPGKRGTPRGYRAGQSIRVVVRDVAKTGTVIDQAVGAGATGVSGPDFFVSDSAHSYDDALGLAFDDAKAKAQLLAARAGAQLGAALSIDEDTDVETLAPTAADSAGSASPLKIAPPTPARPGQSRVNARISVVFELVG
jgi:uncharacterized protein YggE